MAEVRLRKFGAKNLADKSDIAVPTLRRIVSRDELRRQARVGIAGFVAAFVLLVISGQPKTMAGEVLAIWIVDGYLLGHMLLLQRRKKPVFVIGAATGLVLGNMMGEKRYMWQPRLLPPESSKHALLQSSCRKSGPPKNFRSLPCLYGFYWAHASLHQRSRESWRRGSFMEFSLHTRFLHSPTG